MSSSKIDWQIIWKQALVEWQLVATESFFNACLLKTHIVEVETKESTHYVTLGVDNHFWQTEMKRRFHQDIIDTLSRLTQAEVVVEYIVASTPEIVEANTQESDSTPSLFSHNNQTDTDSDLIKREILKHRMEVERNLESFAVSSSNEMAYAAAKAVAHQPGAAYNPLFLYGGVGVGKTHLMQGVGQEILKRDLNTRIIYCSGEEFTNAIIEAIQKKSTIQFRNKYRSVKLLMIDDIQFIAGKDAVQAEFFHTFNTITSAGGQVIMTSDKPPREIDALDQRLKSRFAGGLTIDIGQPNFELRCAILNIKSEQLKIPIPEDVTQFLAQREEDTRALVGSLVMLHTMSLEKKEPITIDLARRSLKQKNSNKNWTIDELVSHVCDTYSQPKSAVVGKKRNQNLTLPRHISMYLLNQKMSKNLVEIGKYFDGRDHTTVMHAVRKIEKMIKKDSEVREQINNLCRQIGVEAV